MKLKFLKSSNALIAFLLTILGFSSSCNPFKTEYGSPSADFIVKGKIVSAETNTPVPEIIVEMRNVSIHGSETYVQLTDTDFSSEWGLYELLEENYPGDKTYQIKFTDTDGALNGEYETLDTTIVFKDPQFSGGDGSWDKGVVEKVLDVKLKPRK